MRAPCKEWPGNRDRQGYGRVTINRKAHRVHRKAWEDANGPIPPGICVLHACDNPPCYELTHLFLGTRRDNAADRDRKGRHAETQKRSCPAGHLYSPENTYRIPSSGGRVCRECQRQHNRRVKARLRELKTFRRGCE